MAEIDDTITSKVYVPKPGEGIGNLVDMYGKYQEIQQRQIQMNALKDYGAAIDSGVAPEVAARHLLKVNPKLYEETQSAVQRGRDVNKLNQFGKEGNLNTLRGASPDTYAGTAGGQRVHQEVHNEWLTKNAHEILKEKDPARKQQLWQDAGKEALKRGIITQEQWDGGMSNAPPRTIDSIADGLIRRGTDPTKYRASSGEAQGAAAAAEAPYKVIETDPTKSIQTPATRPGGPAAGAVPIQPGTFADPTPMQNAPAPLQGGGINPAIPQGGPVSAPEAGRALMGGVTAPTPPPIGDLSNPYYNRAPSMRVAPSSPSGPGIIDPGQHPSARLANEKALDIMEKDISPTVNASAKTKASLSTMEAELNSGKVSTNSLADLRMAIGGFINGVLNEPDAKTASAIIGMKLPDAEVLQKETTRMGLLFARQTEGAREAVQAIRIALAANPSMLNTVDGNKKIIGIMKAASDYELERGKAAQAYYSKQQDTTGTAHLTGFENWFNTEHAPSKFISKAVPYPLEPSVKQGPLEDGVTYEWPKKDPKTGTTLKDREGNTVKDKGIWNSERKGFVLQ